MPRITQVIIVVLALLFMFTNCRRQESTKASNNNVSKTSAKKNLRLNIPSPKVKPDSFLPIKIVSRKGKTEIVGTLIDIKREAEKIYLYLWGQDPEVKIYLPHSKYPLIEGKFNKNVRLKVKKIKEEYEVSEAYLYN